MTLLAVGMLAVAGMQTTAMNANSTSLYHTTALQLAEEMVERVRVNAGNFPASYDGLDTGGDCTALPEPVKGDCSQWQARLAASPLRNAVGTVGVVDSNPMANTATATVTVQWGGGSTVTLTTIIETWGI